MPPKRRDEDKEMEEAREREIRIGNKVPRSPSK